ncbi:glutamine synthetase [Streptomyces sp. Ag109_O5-1]|uniref:glutamine synthetase family protein n=1 Tax=Streptomyces sp. Ag109_O5-1 TaxID=1938851 RepID=UPI000F4F2C7F|nr:glutamine synthetase family protein [Streptomyces sp. Ag109_O5-1]RPE39084.1 glutamine synthetase [Streptomyces sp. Ag109_O5-1]
MNNQHAMPDADLERGAFSSFMDLKEAAEHGDIRTLLAAIPDMQGRLKGKRLAALPLLDEIDADANAPVAEACAYILATNINMDPLAGFDLTGWADGFRDIRARADWSTLRLLPYLPHTAVVLCDAVYADTAPVAIAPRQMLRAQLERLAELGYVPQVGLESEFLLYNRDGEPVMPHNMDYALDHPPHLSDFFRHLEDALFDAGIRVLAVKTEGQRGQIEVTFPYGPALEACDSYVLYKQTVKHLAVRHGMLASFMAAPATGVGSGLHAHLSLLREGEPAFATTSPRDLPTEAMRHSIAGLLAAMPHLALLYAPYPNSYKRYGAYSFAPKYMNWGIDNRGCAIRVTGHGQGTHLENRLPGADTNPYLGIAATIASIAYGLRDKPNLPPVSLGDAYTDQTSPSVPWDLSAALASFASSSLANDLFGQDVVRHYTRAAEAELAEHRRMVTDIERELLDRA